MFAPRKKKNSELKILSFDIKYKRKNKLKKWSCSEKQNRQDSCLGGESVSSAQSSGTKYTQISPYSYFSHKANPSRTQTYFADVPSVSSASACPCLCYILQKGFRTKVLLNLQTFHGGFKFISISNSLTHSHSHSQRNAVNSGNPCDVVPHMYPT